MRPPDSLPKRSPERLACRDGVSVCSDLVILTAKVTALRARLPELGSGGLAGDADEILLQELTVVRADQCDIILQCKRAGWKHIVFGCLPDAPNKRNNKRDTLRASGGVAILSKLPIVDIATPATDAPGNVVELWRTRRWLLLRYL